MTIVRGGRKIVERLTFRVAAGEILALLGPSGRGKTSVLHAGAGLLRPASGTVERRTEAQSVLFQEARLLPWMSVGRNVRLGARDRSVYSLRPCPRVDEVLAEVGLAGHAGSAPFRLSGGMQRRAALARVLYSEPQVVFADEPFAHLDAQSAGLVASALRRLADSGAAVLITAHEETAVFPLMGNYRTLFL